MRPKKVGTTHHIFQQGPRNDQPKPQPKRKLKDVRSLEQKCRPEPHPNLLPNPKIIRVEPNYSAGDYDWQRKDRQTMNYVSIGESLGGMGAYCQPQVRTQRNSEARQFLQGSRENHFLNENNMRWLQNSSQKIKIMSVQNKQKSLSRSENGVGQKADRHRTHQDTPETHLRHNRSSFMNKSNREETTGIMTMTTSGKVYDEYQLSDFDFQVPNNHTFNTSTGQALSFNDSGSWSRQLQEIPEQHQVRPQDIQKLNYSNQPIINCRQFQQILYNSREGEQRPKSPFQTLPKKELIKVKSNDLLGSNSRPLSTSIVVGNEPPPRPVVRRMQNAGQQGHRTQEEKYLIRSKNKTLDQLSVKQSLIVGFDNYYQ